MSSSQKFNYFPGCSLATTAKENNASLKQFLLKFDVQLTELNDWNCCGSSSTHSIDSDLALSLGARNLFLASDNRPLLIACPSCFLRLKQAKLELDASVEKQEAYAKMFNLSYNPDLELVPFFELLSRLEAQGRFSGMRHSLNGLKIAPYYGCMLARPPQMNREKNYHGLIEKTMDAFGGNSLSWPYYSRCCGTFLSVSRPKIAQNLVNRIMDGAVAAGAECIVTACAMCHLNLEIRSSGESRIPVFHFSELLSLATEGHARKDWLKRHLIDPVTVLKHRGLG